MAATRSISRDIGIRFWESERCNDLGHTIRRPCRRSTPPASPPCDARVGEVRRAGAGNGRSYVSAFGAAEPTVTLGEKGSHREGEWPVNLEVSIFSTQAWPQVAEMPLASPVRVEPCPL